MSDYYVYRRKIESQKRRRRAVAVLLVVLALLCAGIGYLWFGNGSHAEQNPDTNAQPLTATAAPPATETPEQAATAEQAATGESAAPYTPARLLPQVDDAAWDSAAAQVEQTIDLDYLNTDSRMVAVPALGTASRANFDTAAFLGDSLTEGMELYDAGYTNAHVFGYRSAGPEAVVNGTTLTDTVRQVSEVALDALAESQPDFVYVLFGTNSLVQQGNEDGFMAYYGRMLEMIEERLPGVMIYVQSIPGVQEWVAADKPGLDNTRIATVNNMLANLALQKGCYFINIQEALTYHDGSQIDEYAAADGIHMQAAGYGAWADYLATHTVWDRRNRYEGTNPLYILGS